MAKTKKISAYELSLKVNEEEFKVESQTILEGLAELFKDSTIYKTTGLLTVSKDKLTGEKIIPIRLMKRLYMNRIYREITSKLLESLLK